MQEIYPTFASGDLKANANSAFELAEKGPLVVMSRTTPKVVMIGPDLWNETARELKRLRRIHAAELDRRVAEVKAGDYMTMEQVENELGL